jgi:hypothetical protein
MTEEERFEEWWKEFENTDDIVNFCDEHLKYVAELAFHAGILNHDSIMQAKASRGIS